MPLPRFARLAALASLTACGTPSCVARGTRIRTPTGDTEVESLRVDDIVIVVEPRSGATTLSRLTAIRTATRECGLLEVGALRLEVTTDHPLFDPDAGDFFPAGDWLLGARTALLRLEAGVERVVVTRAVVFAGVAQVFDLTVEHEWHTFVANGVVVHNKQPAACAIPGGGGATTTIGTPSSERPVCSCGAGQQGRWTCAGSGGQAFCDECGSVDAGP